MSEKQFRWLAAALIAFAALLTYANTFANDFVWDDASSILLHKDVQSPSHILQLFTHDQHAYGRGQGNFYRPLVSVSFMVDTWLSRPLAVSQDAQTTRSILSPFLFHVSNLLWHGMVGIALFMLMTVMGAPRPVRLLAPLVYVVHPLHTEAIAYISGRADPMAAVFVLLALCAALALPSPRNAIVSTLCFAAALLSKESAMIYPFLLLLALLVMRRTDPSEAAAAPARRNRIAPLIASGVVLGVYAALRATVLRFARGGEGPASPLLQRVTEAGQAFALYVKLMFVPTGLHMERTLDGVPGWMALFGWVLILACIGVVVVAQRAKRHRLAFALGFFLITWFPISGIFPLNAPMAEHWMYLPMLGFAWALFELAWMVTGPGPLRYPLYLAAYTACVALIALSTQRNYDWRNNESLYVATLKENPKSIRVNFNLAVTYEDLVGNMSGARREYERVLNLYSDRKAGKKGSETGNTYYDDELEAHLSLGKIYVAQRMPNKAMYHFDTLRQIEVNETNSPIIADAYLEYARLLLALGQNDDARKLMDEGIKRVPALKEQRDAMDRLRRTGTQNPSPAETPAQAHSAG